MTVKPTAIRYIKLGRGGSWERNSLDRGEIHFGSRDVSHELASTLDLAQIKLRLQKCGRSPASATREAREIIEFYKQDEQCLWITFAREHLWWAFAEPGVTWIGGDGRDRGERFRQTIGGWKSHDINGKQLRVCDLTSRLTKVAAYRRVICNVDAEDYLMRRINDEVSGITQRATAAKSALIDVLLEAVRSLHQIDLETVVDVMFARSGWSRVSAIGGTQRLIDFELENITTEERAAVQIKSEADQCVFDDYISRIDDADRFDRFYFVCHSPRGNLKVPPERNDIHLWIGRDFSSRLMKLGLYDWVLQHASC